MTNKDWWHTNAQLILNEIKMEESKIERTTREAIHQKVINDSWRLTFPTPNFTIVLSGSQQFREMTEADVRDLDKRHKLAVFGSGWEGNMALIYFHNRQKELNEIFENNGMRHAFENHTKMVMFQFYQFVTFSRLNPEETDSVEKVIFHMTRPDLVWDESCRTSNVVALARMVYRGRHDLIPILNDALLDAGVMYQVIADYFRGEWIVDHCLNLRSYSASVDN